MKFKKFIFKVLVAYLFLSTSCSNNPDPNSYNANIQVPVKEKTPEELRQELKYKEQNHPLTYLSNQGTWRKNLIGESVLEGKINNSATLANFKDIVLNIQWLTKTKTVLDTKQFTIYEFVNAGQSITYKIKLLAPTSTQAASVEIASATTVQ